MRISIPVLLSATLFIFLFCGCNHIIHSEEETTDVNETVIQTIEKSRPVTSGNLITKTRTDDENNIHVEYYDSVGNLVENYIWDKNENAVSHSIMIYTPDNKLQKKEFISSSTSDSVIETYQYDANGNISTKNVSEYTANRLIRSSNYDSEGVLINYSVSEYENDIRTKIRKFNPDDTLIEYSSYEYNQSGQMTKYSTFDKNDKIVKYTIFEYNESGNLKSEKYYSGENTLKNYNEYTYNDDGTKKSVISYDSQGNLISENYF